jgi:pimeloyl-ACP methyl ester carboxylesterase
MPNIIRTSKGPVEYRLSGEGPCLLVLNGSHTNCNSLIGSEPFLLSQGYQLVIPSRPGYGKTAIATGPTAEIFADTLREVLDLLHLDRVPVLAISGAGPTALQFAARHGDRVASLVLQCAVTRSDWPDSFTRRWGSVIFHPTIEQVTWGILHTIGRSRPTSLLHLLMKSFTTLNPNQVVQQMSQSQRNGAISLLMGLRSGGGFVLDVTHHSGNLSMVTAPTLIIHSPFDGSVAFSHAQYALEQIPHAVLYESTAPSHLIWFSDDVSNLESSMADFLRDFQISH